MPVRALLQFLEPRLTFSNSGVPTAPPSSQFATPSQTTALPVLKVDNFAPNPSTPVSFSPVGAGYIYHLGNYHNFSLASLVDQKATITNIQILGEGFISPDLVASSFPVTISTQLPTTENYYYRTDFLADFDVYLYSSTPGPKSANLRITTDSGIIDLALTGTVQTPVKSAEVHLDDYLDKDRQVRNGQKVNIGAFQQKSSGVNARSSFNIVNTGNVPVLADAMVQFSFSVSGGGGSSGSVTSPVTGGPVTYNVLKPGTILDTPGIRPGDSQHLDLHIPTGKIGTYNARVLVRTDAPNLPEMSFSAIGKVVSTLPEPNRYGVITGSATKMSRPKGTVSIASVSLVPQPTGGLLAGNELARSSGSNFFKVKLANSTAVAFSGDSEIYFDTYVNNTLIDSQYSYAGVDTQEGDFSVPAKGSRSFIIPINILDQVPDNLAGQTVTIKAHYAQSLWSNSTIVATHARLNNIIAGLDFSSPDLNHTPSPKFDSQTPVPTLLNLIYPVPQMRVTNSGNVDMDTDVEVVLTQRIVQGSAYDYDNPLPRMFSWSAHVSLHAGQSQSLQLTPYSGDFYAYPRYVFDFGTPNAPLDFEIRYLTQTIHIPLTSADLPQSSSPG